MRTLVVAPFCPNFSFSHRQERISSILRSLAAQGEVDVFPLNQPEPGAERETLFCSKALLREIKTYLSAFAPLPVQLLPPVNPVVPLGRQSALLIPALTAKVYDFVLVERFYYFEQFRKDVRRYQPTAHLAVDCSELYFAKISAHRDFLAAQKLQIDSRHRRRPLDSGHAQRILELQKQTNHVEEEELNAYRHADTVIVPDQRSKAILAQKLLRTNILVCTSEIPKCGKKKAQRSGMAVIGDFQDEADTSVALFLKHELAPVLGEDFPLRIGGLHPTSEMLSLASHGISAHKFFCEYNPSRFQEVLEKSSLIFAPVFFGALGVSSLLAGIANGCVPLTNPRGASLLGLEADRDCLVGKDAESFKTQIDRLAKEKDLGARILAAAKKKLLQDKKSDLSVREGVGHWLEKHKNKHPAKILFPKSAARKPNKISFQPDSSPLCSVIVSCHNEWPFTQLCLERLAATQPGNIEVILVDNASTDETARKARDIKGLRIITNKVNLGFIKAVNQGLKAGRGKNFLVLHNDTLLPPFWLESFLSLLAKVANIGLIGPSYHSHSHDNFPVPVYANVDEFLLAAEKHRRYYLHSWADADLLWSACLFFSRSIYETVGEFDANFGMGFFENDDFCLRIRAAGKKVLTDNAVYAHHFGGATVQNSTVGREILFERSMAQFVFKWGERGVDHTKEFHRSTLIQIQFNPSV